MYYTINIVFKHFYYGNCLTKKPNNKFGCKSGIICTIISLNLDEHKYSIIINYFFIKNCYI